MLRDLDRQQVGLKMNIDRTKIKLKNGEHGPANEASSDGSKETRRKLQNAGRTQNITLEDILGRLEPMFTRGFKALCMYVRIMMMMIYPLSTAI